MVLLRTRKSMENKESLTAEKQELLNSFIKELDLIKSYSNFDTYFNCQFDITPLKKTQYKFFKKFAKDSYYLALDNVLVTSVKFNELKLLISTGSISYMGKYGVFNKIKVHV